MADHPIEEFQEQYPSLDSYWRSIVLFGRNTASYKFALAESLMELAKHGQTAVTLEELAVPFSRHLCYHLRTAPKQATSTKSQFLDACRRYNAGEISYQKLIDVTVAKGFNNVIDAFHTVNRAPVPVQFYEKDFQGRNKRILLTDDIYRLLEIPFHENFAAEADARWNLVETAWELEISRNLLNVRYDDDARVLFVDKSFRRKDVTSARSALNGYQKGKCFYCFRDITVADGTANTCDVDHFFPHTLQPHFPDISLDGVWNLVLACPECNRGAGGKFARVPSVTYLTRLHKRNEFLISSHHPLRETILKQTGATEPERRAFLKQVDQRAIDILVHRWETEQAAPATF